MMLKKDILMIALNNTNSISNKFAKYTAKNIIPEERHLNDSFEQHKLGSKAANATAAVNKHKAGEFKHVMNNMKDMNTGDGNGTTDHASPA